MAAHLPIIAVVFTVGGPVVSVVTKFKVRDIGGFDTRRAVVGSFRKLGERPLVDVAAESRRPHQRGGSPDPCQLPRIFAQDCDSCRTILGAATAEAE